MSLDRLLAELDKEERDFTQIGQLALSVLKEYVGIMDAQIDLLGVYKSEKIKMEVIANIIHELTSNIQALNQILKNISKDQTSADDIDPYAGHILRSEQEIDSLIEKFEELEKVDFSTE